MSSARDDYIKNMKKMQGYTKKKKAPVVGNEANPIIANAIKQSNKDVIAMAPAPEQAGLRNDYGIEQPTKTNALDKHRIGDVEDDPRFIFGGTDGSGRGIYQTEGPRIINRGGKTLLTNLSAGRLSNQFNNNLTQTPLQQEIYKRQGGFVTNNGTGESSYTGGNPIDPKTRKMLENIGMVKAPMSKREIEQRKSDAFIANYQTLLNDGRSPQEAEIMANNIRNGKAIDTGVNLGPQVQTVAAPSHGGFFESLGRLSGAIREDNQRRSDERFNRKQSLEEDLARSEMAYRQKRTNLYDDIQIAGINRKNSLTNRTNGLTALDPIKVNAEAEQKTARGNYYNSQAKNLDAKTKEVAANAAIERDLKAAKTGNQQALMRLNKEKANAIPIKLRADVQNILAQAGLRQAKTGLTNAKTNEVAANAQVDRVTKQIRANAYAKDIAGRYNLNEAKVREIITSEPYNKLLRQAKATKLKADAGNANAKTEMIQLENQMKEMFLTGAK